MYFISIIDNNKKNNNKLHSKQYAFFLIFLELKEDEISIINFIFKLFSVQLRFVGQ